MARFYGSIEGSARTTGTRQGTTKSGIVGHVRGWDIGAKVVGFADHHDKDRFDIIVTSGSNGGASKHIAQVWIDDKGRITVKSYIRKGTTRI